jgi:hypothetical protein
VLFKDISSTVVAHKDTIRLLHAIINKLDLHAHSIDVKSAFLIGVLDHDVCVYPPDGVSLPPNKLSVTQVPLRPSRSSPRLARETRRLASLCRLHPYPLRVGNRWLRDKGLIGQG